MTELLPNIFAIEVPNGIVDIELTHSKDKVVFWTSEEGHIDIELPTGSYEIMFATSSVTEYQAATISPGSWSKYFENAPGPLFMDYSDNIYRFDNAIKSLQSLLKSKGLTAGNYLIIKMVG